MWELPYMSGGVNPVAINVVLAGQVGDPVQEGPPHPRVSLVEVRQVEYAADFHLYPLRKQKYERVQQLRSAIV